jgi:hypothetical protein
MVKRVTVENVDLLVIAERKVKRETRANQAILVHKVFKVQRVTPEKGAQMDYKAKLVLKVTVEILEIREKLAQLDREEKRAKKEIPVPKGLLGYLVHPVHVVLAVLKETEVRAAIREKRAKLVQRENAALKVYRELREQKAM